VALLLACAACGDDNENGPLAQSALDAMQADVSAASTPDAGSGASPAPSASDADVSPSDAGRPPAHDSGAAIGLDAGGKADAARPPLVLELPKANVMCGTSACDTLDNVCCESWSLNKGFGTSRTCVTRDACYKLFQRSGEQDRAIPHECDGKEDCSGGQVCCMVADGQPLCSFDDLTAGMCTSKVYGPGGSGICADDPLCMLGSIQFIAAGVPLGVLACNDDSDCQDRKGTTCQPEQDGSITTGKGIKARPYVKVCR
jgi:hypothetical protein